MGSGRQGAPSSDGTPRVGCRDERGKETKSTFSEVAALTAGELMDRSGIIRGAVDGDSLKIVSAFYSLEDGSVTFAD